MDFGLLDPLFTYIHHGGYAVCRMQSIQLVVCRRLLIAVSRGHMRKISEAKRLTVGPLVALWHPPGTLRRLTRPLRTEEEAEQIKVGIPDGVLQLTARKHLSTFE